MRLILGLSIIAMLTSAVMLFAISIETRRIAADVAKRDKHLETLKRDLAVLKAERAYLARPERIAPLARALGLRPARGSQFADPDQFSVADPRRSGEAP